MKKKQPTHSIFHQLFNKIITSPPQKAKKQTAPCRCVGCSSATQTGTEFLFSADY